MLRFLFWNLSRKLPRGHLEALRARHALDVLAFAEPPAGVASLRRCLGPDFDIQRGVRFAWAARTRLCHVTSRREADHSVRLRLATDGGTELSLVIVHAPSKLHCPERVQAGSARTIARQIQEFERRCGHDRTVVVGDFNMDPFEPGMVEPDAFHAVLCPRVAARGVREIGGAVRKMLYNPTWRILANGSAPASYYFESGARTTYFWHMFDQVLLRPSLVGRFVEPELEILTSSDHGTLLDARGRPDEAVSDHLPLKFALNLA